MAKLLLAIVGGIGLSLFSVTMVVQVSRYPAEMQPRYFGALAILILIAGFAVAYAWKKRGKAGVVHLLALAGIAVLVCSVAAGSVAVFVWLLSHSLKG